MTVKIWVAPTTFANIEAMIREAEVRSLGRPTILNVVNGQDGALFWRHTELPKGSFLCFANMARSLGVQGGENAVEFLE